MPPSTQVGFIGLGAMGNPMSSLLATAGYPLVVFDADPDRTAAVANRIGAAAAEDLAWFGACGVVITMLPDSSAVDSVVAGPGGLCDVLEPGSLCIDMSSSAPAATVTLAGICSSNALTLVDAPVSGGVRRAVDGTLSIMVGGGDADVARALPYLEVLGARIFRCGAVGAGHAAKALNNLLSAIGLLGAAEVLSVGERFGLDPAVLLEVLNASTGRNNSTELKFSQFIFPGTFDSGFSLQLMVKDIATAVELAEQADMAVPLSLACLAAWRNAASELDRGADHTAVAQFVDRHNATRIAGHDVE